MTLVMSNETRRALEQDAARRGWLVRIRVRTEETTIAEALGGNHYERTRYHVDVTARSNDETYISATVEGWDEAKAHMTVTALVEGLPDRSTDGNQG